MGDARRSEPLGDRLLNTRRCSSSSHAGTYCPFKCLRRHGIDSHWLTGQIVPGTIGPVTTFNELFQLWDSIPEMAEAVGKTHWSVKKWKQRGRIPSDDWPAVIAAARAKGKKLSAEQLLSMHGSTRRASGE